MNTSLISPHTLHPETASVLEMKQAVHHCGLRHVAIIMDGNRRWASLHQIVKTAGHRQGAKTLKKIVQHAVDTNLQALTLYAFSTENWSRASDEVDFILRLISHTLKKEIREMHQNNVKLRFVGLIEGLPSGLQRVFADAAEMTQHNTGLHLQIAANYGSRAEMLTAMQSLAQQVQAGTLQPEDITEKTFSDALFTHHLPDPDLVIRTGGDHRLSNFLLWQSAYAEFYATPTFWPDFAVQHFNEAILTFAGRERRFGK
jgi:undecaprenyl diphosphate synthase